MRFADLQVWGVMDGVLGQVILATLPGDAGEHGLASGAQARMIVGGDEGEPPHAAGHQAVQEGPPVGLGLAESTGDPEDPAALIGPHTDGREHGGIADHAILADNFNLILELSVLILELRFR